MDARWSTVSFGFLLLAALTAVPAQAAGRDARTQNFIINAPTPQLAQQVGEQAERYRAELAQKWLGRELPPWSAPCTLKVVAGNLPAQGVTTYNRYPGHVGDFQMEVVGTPERIMDSVLPHEVTHAVLATHFGRPLPRWADEGVSTTVEHVSERAKHEAKLREFLSTRRGLPMNRMFMLKEYPSDMLPLYAQGYSVCRFLIEQNGHQEFIRFLEDYMSRQSWTKTVQQHYGYESLSELQDHWLRWVADGSGPVDQYTKRATSGDGSVRVAAAEQRAVDAPPSAMLADGRGSTPATPASRVTPSGANTPAASLASLAGDSDGWYVRRRNEIEAGHDPAPVSRAVGVASAETAPAAEPSSSVAQAAAASPYTASQPQPEQGATATELAPAGPAAHWSPSGSTKWR